MKYGDNIYILVTLAKLARCANSENEYHAFCQIWLLFLKKIFFLRLC